MLLSFNFICLYALFWFGIPVEILDKTNNSAKSSQVIEQTVVTAPLALSSRSLPMVRVKLPDGQWHMMLIDTGTQNSRIDKNLVRQLKQRIHKDKDINGLPLSYVQCVAEIGSESLRVENGRFVISDLSYPASGFAGILGYDILGRFALSFDFSGKELLIFYPGKVIVPQPKGVTVARISMIKQLRGYSIDAKVNGVRTNFLIDTGAQKTYFNENPSEKNIRPLVKLKGFFNQQLDPITQRLIRQESSASLFDSVEVGAFQWKSPLLYALTQKTNIGNVLGLDFLQQYQFVIDFPGLTLYLAEDNSLKKKQTSLVGTGCSFVLQGQRLIVSEVIEPSPAWDSGVSVGDEVLEIANSEIAAILDTPKRIEELVEKFSQLGQTIIIKVKKSNGDIRSHSLLSVDLLQHGKSTK